MEILVVVVILGILAAVVVPQFTGAVEEASENSAVFELQKIRRAIDVYTARNNNVPPTITTGYATWGPLVGTGAYLKESPSNRYIPATNEQRIYSAADATPDDAYQTNFGWIYNSSTGEIWAGGFDSDDEPLPKP